MARRFDELTYLEQQQVQVGTSVPQVFGTLARFVANPSTVSVESYKRMADTDDTIGSGIDFMNLSMTSRFGSYTHKSQEVQSFVRRALKQMDGSWNQNLNEMFSAEWNGFSVTEQVWKFDANFDGYPGYVPKKLVTYPPLTIVFAVDAAGDILPDGIYQYQRYSGGSNYAGMFSSMGGGGLNGFRPDFQSNKGNYPYPIRIAADISYMAIGIPRDKCIHLTSSCGGNFNNPYGQSILRRAYKHWVSKDAYMKMRLIALDRKGTPLLIGYAAPNDTVLQQNQHGTPGGSNYYGAAAGIQGAVPSPIQKMSTAQALSVTMANVHNASFIVVPGKKDETYNIEAIQVQGDMIAFKDAVSDSDRGIMRSLLLPPLMLGGDGGGSFSLGQEQNRIWKQVIDGKNEPYKQCIIEQFISKIVRFNFPQSAWIKDGYGEFTVEDFDPEIMQVLSGIYSEMAQSGFISPSSQVDMDAVRMKLNFPKKAVEQMGAEGSDLFGSNSSQSPAEVVLNGADNPEDDKALISRGDAFQQGHDLSNPFV